MKSKTTIVLWAVFISILLVLLPHTAWMFRQLEPAESVRIIGEFDAADLLSYIAAFAFEAAIAVLIHKLSRHIEGMKKGKSRWDKFVYCYLNPFATGLYIATGISMLANLAHAVEFGTSIKIFTQWGIPSWVYSVAFGGILPVVSLTFARVLSNVSDDEGEPNPELTEARAKITEANKKFAESERQRTATEHRARAAEEQLKQTESRLNAIEGQFGDTEERLRHSEFRASEAERRAQLAEERFGAIGDLVKYLFSEDKRQRIVAARQQWPQLTNSAIAVIAGASPAYVSQVLSEAPIDVTAEMVSK